MKRSLQQFRNLMVLALADGKFSEEELVFLSARCGRWDISDSDFRDAVEYARSAKAEIVIPPGRAAREELLRDMLRMMAADGQLADIERKLFAVVSAACEMTKEDVDILIEGVITQGRI